MSKMTHRTNANHPWKVWANNSDNLEAARRIAGNRRAAASHKVLYQERRAAGLCVVCGKVESVTALCGGCKARRITGKVVAS